MNTLAFNLENLGVTEYSSAFTGLAGDFEATAAGLALVGGLNDGTTPVLPSATFSMSLEAGERRLTPHYTYAFGEGIGDASATVTTSAGAAYRYVSATKHDNVARFTLGKGIRDNYLQLKIEGRGQRSLSLDRLEFVTTASTSRRL